MVGSQKMRRWARTVQLSSALAASAALFAAAATAGEPCGTFSACPGTPWPAMDALGRVLPTEEEAGGPRPDRFVGIFYFLWLGQDPPSPGGPFDITRILAADPGALEKPTSPPWGPEDVKHFWSQPLYGYYRSGDPWVLRRHAHLLADAGVDVLIFDTTNGPTYDDVYTALCETFTQVRAEGGRTPQIAFMVNPETGGEVADRIHNTLYRPGRYRDLWFHWMGRPLMLCNPSTASPGVRAFFTLRKAHWPVEMVNTAHAWHWEATYPQPYGFTDDPKIPEQVSVSAAQNLSVRDGRVTFMSRGDARGRSFHRGRQRITRGSMERGANLEEQWRRAIRLDPPFVMVTGWNEWTAGRYSLPEEPIFFCDQYNQEFSRDVEPARTAPGDNYYMQLVANVRRFKGVPPIPAGTGPKTIDVGGDFAQWTDVGPEYTDPDGETLPRDFAGVDFTHYTDQTGRNEFLAAKVARDSEFLYFYARTRNPVTPRPERGWMTLLLDTDANPFTGWEGFDHVVNRLPGEGGALLVERFAGGGGLFPLGCRGGRPFPLSCHPGGEWEWACVHAPEAALRVEGNELHLRVPRAALGLDTERRALRIDFKWTDNLSCPEDPLDWYLSGDVAPSGRFRYRYTAE